MKDHVSPDSETTLHTKSPGFNTGKKNKDGQFKRYGLDSHGGARIQYVDQVIADNVHAR
ncbi:hypothetical protein H5A21_20255 [Pectobacterium aquaticum]|nr:hypothetical protein [Pectobacterium quasiaquaticum]MBN3066333.1 hypothetical protein [Pectobacterium aquaticum]